MLPGEARYASRALWLLDHALGPARVDRRLPNLRPRVRDRLTRALSHRAHSETPVDRRVDLDRATFLREYVAQDRPVVLAGAAKAWRATRTWDFAFFADRYGDLPIQLMNAALGDDGSERAGERRPLGDILRDALAGSSVYPRFVPLLLTNPELLDDLDPRWLLSLRGPTGRGLNLQLFIGGPGTSTALHAAIGSNLFVQVHGRKRWHIVSPAFSAALDVEPNRSPYFFSHVDAERPDTARFPLAGHIDVLVAELEPGDVLYNPPFFWHQVRNPTHSIGVGVRYYDPRAMLRASKTMTALTLLATNPDILTAARLKGDFSRIFSGRYR